MTAARWLLAVLTVAAVGTGVLTYYRAGYNHARRLREVSPGKLYRSGQMTAAGFAAAFDKYGIKTVVNLQEDVKDPLLPAGYLGTPADRESDVCARHGVKYVSLDGGVLDAPADAPGGAPAVLAKFLEVVRDPANQPVLIHCQAGLHRTGLFTAVYRMEIDGRDKAAVVRELRGNGFGTYAATDANLYVKKYIRDYQPRRARGATP